MKTTLRTRFGIGAATTGTLLAAMVLLGPATGAQAYGTSPEELASACADGIDQAGISVSCTFETDHVESSRIQWNRYGDPVTNCAGGSNTVESMIVASRTYTQSWSVGGKFGISFEGVGIEGNSSYTSSEAQTSGVNRSISAGPGQKVAATVGTTINTEAGRMRVEIFDNGGYQDGTSYSSPDTYYIEGATREVPTDTREQGQDQVNCGEHFTIDPESTPV